MKQAIKTAYIANLKETYDFYQDGSRPLELAMQSADNALAGHLKLEGAAWEKAVQSVTGMKRWTMRQLAELPD